MSKQTFEKKTFQHNNVVSFADNIINIFDNDNIDQDNSYVVSILNNLAQCQNDSHFNVYGIDGTKVKVTIRDSDDITEIKKQVSEETDTYTINRLTMISLNHCMVCNKKGPDVKCNIISIGKLWGWIFCDECHKTERIHKIILGYINTNKKIPCSWICKSTNFNLRKPYYSSSHLSIENDPLVYVCDKRYVHFFRRTKSDTQQPIHSGIITHFDDEGCTISCDNSNGYYIYLNFIDNITRDIMCRIVSLENIMANTKGFYEELTTSKDLLFSDEIKIAFTDLSQELQNDIHEVYKNSLSKDNTSFKK
jgi:hypothetical protein